MTRWGWRGGAVALGAGMLVGCAGGGREDLFERLRRDVAARAGERAPALDGAGEPAGPAGGLAGGGLTLADLLGEAERVHPEVRAAWSRVGEAGGRVWQAGRYPNPTAGVTAGEVGFDGRSSNTIVGVTQPIVVGGRLRAAVAGAEAEEAARLAEVERVRLDVLGRVAALHARVLGLAGELGVVDELLGVGERTLGIAETRFEARAVAEADVIRPRVEVYQLRADRGRIARELASAEERLGLLVGSGPIVAGRLAGRVSLEPAPLDGAGLRAAVGSSHPALAVAAREIEAAEAALERVRAERVPDVGVTAGVGYSEEQGQGIAEVGVSAEVPLWDRRRGDEAAARFAVMRARQELEAARARVLGELAAAVGDYEAAREQLAVVRAGVVPDAERAFAGIDEAYRAGSASFIDLLDAQRTLMQARRAQVELAGRAAEARARVASVAGLGVLTSDRFEWNRTAEPQAAPGGAEDGS